MATYRLSKGMDGRFSLLGTLKVGDTVLLLTAEKGIAPAEVAAASERVATKIGDIRKQHRAVGDSGDIPGAVT